MGRPSLIIRRAWSELLQVWLKQKCQAQPTTYHFTLKVPQDAGESLQAVTIVQHENPDTVVFQVNKN